MKITYGVFCLATCLAASAFAQHGSTASSSAGVAAKSARVKSDASSLTITCNFVANVLITDPHGKRLGDDPKAHAHYDELPNAYYEGGGLDDDETGEAEEDPAKILFIPNPVAGEFKVAVFLEKTGEYSCEVLGYDSTGATSKAATGDVEGKEGETQKFTVTFNGTPGSKVKVVR